MTENRMMVRVQIMGESFEVPEGSTIIMAMEYAGYQLKRGIGCREGFCGACATLYREKNDYKIKGGLACQTVVTDGMVIAQIPFVPAEKPVYDINELTPDINTIKAIFPTVFRCVACNTCTKACPQDIEVMDYIQALKRGNIERAADLSFDCIRCGLCALRCPAEIVQYNAAILAQRLYGKYLSKKNPQLDKRVKEIEDGKYSEEINELMDMDREKLTETYYNREIKIS
ncbi:MAG: 4Fe-4S dicluster domain-containing protein [Candidatus Marinimicrobia bacterium]|nr:4Fe-4S dicluster domain-containing protein [Candidatus Neomarinimicrobiota bacterium]